MSHISTLRLHQLRLGELPPEEEGRLRAHLGDCSLCSSRLDGHFQARQQFQAQPVPAWAAPKAAPWWQRLWTLALVPAMGLGWMLFRPPEIAAVEESGIRTKGELPVLEAWVQTGASARPLYEGERLSEGAKVQLKFNPGSHRFVTLAGRDGGGTVEVYGTLPAKGPGIQAAPFALTLDNSKGEQVFYAILTDIRPDTHVVQQALTQDPVTLDRAELRSVAIRKE